MRTFLGLVVAPSLALACQSILFGLVLPSCSVQTRAGLHQVAAAFLAATVLLAVQSSREWRAHRARASGDDQARSGRVETRRFLSACATAVASLSALLVVMMWFSAWVLPPCSA
jgi:hypothetical protein